MKFFLIGFMGSGKSLIGNLLAAKLGIGFIDLDTVLEDKCSESITDIFSNNGEKYFRDLEAKCLRDTARLENMVIATGGGAPCYYDNMVWMNENGVTIFLDVPINILAERLHGEIDHRPLLKGQTGTALSQYIEEKLADRMVFYGQAQFACHADGQAEEIVDAIVSYFSRFVK